MYTIDVKIETKHEGNTSVLKTPEIDYYKVTRDFRGWSWGGRPNNKLRGDIKQLMTTGKITHTFETLNDALYWIKRVNSNRTTGAFNYMEFLGKSKPFNYIMNFNPSDAPRYNLYYDYKYVAVERPDETTYNVHTSISVDAGFILKENGRVLDIRNFKKEYDNATKPVVVYSQQRYEDYKKRLEVCPPENMERNPDGRYYKVWYRDPKTTHEIRKNADPEVESYVRGKRRNLVNAYDDLRVSSTEKNWKAKNKKSRKSWEKNYTGTHAKGIYVPQNTDKYAHHIPEPIQTFEYGGVIHEI